MPKMILRLLACGMLAACTLPLFCACRDEKTTTSSSSTKVSTTTSATTTTTMTTTTTATTTTEPPLGDAIIEQTGAAYVARDLAYGDRVDMSSQAQKAGSQIYDVYLPKMPNELDADTPVMLFLHGGAWSVPDYDKTADGAWLGKALAQKGMVVFSMNYVLQNSSGTAENATAEDMLADIDAMMFHISLLLPKLGIETDSIAIGGNSAGAHLASLYAYKCKDTSPLKIAFLVDIVGPTNLLTYKPVMDHLMDLAFGNYEIANAAITAATGIGFGLFAGMAGVSAGEEHMDEMWVKLEEYSPVTYVSADVCPTIMAYAHTENAALPSFALPEGFESDGLVSTECYYEMVEKLTSCEVPHCARMFENTEHGQMWETAQSTWIVSEILEFAELYL